MLIENKKIILRDMQESDIDDLIYWNTVETEWMLWDAPWIHDNDNVFDCKQYRNDKQEHIQQLSKSNQLRTRFEVCVNDHDKTHIGYISSYYINEDFKIDDEGKNITIGMDICSPLNRRNGYGSSAYQLFIEYLRNHGYHKIYTQTWSGNIPLIKMVEKLGFVECNRFEKIRLVRDEYYDALTFVLK